MEIVLIHWMGKKPASVITVPIDNLGITIIDLSKDYDVMFRESKGIYTILIDDKGGLFRAR